MKKIFSFIFIALLSSCTHLFFQPDHYLYVPPEKINLKYRNIFFPSRDMTRLHAWFFPSKEEEGDTLYVLFHGNAQNLSSHYLSLSWLTRYKGDVFVWDYRGYGLSQSEPDQEGIYQDSLGALDYISNLYRENKNYKRLIIVAQSLGGNILLKALSDYPNKWSISAIVIDSSFPSYRDMAKDRMRTVWFLYPFSYLSSLLINDDYAPKKHLKKVKIPTLVMHSEQDRVVPSKFGKEIFEALPGPKKALWLLPEGRHIGTLGNGKGETEKAFLDHINQLLKP